MKRAVHLPTNPLTPHVNAVLRATIARHDLGRFADELANLTNRQFRDAWIGYAYEKSGYQWLIAQIAAGHTGPETLRRYLAQRRWRLHDERQIRVLQDAIMAEVRDRRLVDGAALRMLVQMKEITEEQRQRLEDYRRLDDNPHVITGRKPGSRLTDLQHPWRRIRNKANLPDVRIHDLRHSYPCGALALGEGLPMIGKLLGHTQVQTTARYAHLANDPVKLAAGRVSDTIGAAIMGKAAKPPARRSQNGRKASPASEDRRR